MNKGTFKFFVKQLNSLEKNDTNYRLAITLPKRIAIALYGLASSAENRTIANLFGVGRSTVGELMLEFCEAVCEHFLPKFMNFYPPTQNQIEENVSNFENIWGFPQTFSAVDGCHIEIKPPVELAVDYYNYKGWYSIILLAAVDYKYRFNYINVGSPGKNNDSYIYEKSKLKQQHENNAIFLENSRMVEDVSVPVMLVGDGAFRLSNYLMKPYPGTYLTEEETNYNRILSRTRRVVENAFGHLKARFRTIGKGIDANINDAATIVRTCCTIHNVLIYKKDVIKEKWVEEVNKSLNNKSQPEYQTVCGNNNESALRIRNVIKQYLCTKGTSEDLLDNAELDNGPETLDDDNAVAEREDNTDMDEIFVVD